MVVMPTLCSWAAAATVLLPLALEVSATTADGRGPTSLPKVSLSSMGADGKRVFLDASQNGRQRIFHGTNVVVKGPPWLPRRDKYNPKTSLVGEDFSFMQEAGINLIRLGAMWPGVEPARGQYNQTYIQELRAIIQEAADYDIYVLLDMHQDVLSEFFCGEGIPAWAVEAPHSHFTHFPFPLWLRPASLGADGFPTRQDCAKIQTQERIKQLDGWASGFVAYATGTAYDALYTNHNNLTEVWGAFWAKLAKEVLDLPNVLGFELINEPFAGNPWTDPLLMLPGRAEAMRLQPAYDVLVHRIREVDQQTLVFFAGVTWDNTVPVGFTSAPGGPEEADRSVLAYHYYNPPQRKGHFQEYREQRLKDAARLSTGLMMTESCCDELVNEAQPQLAAAGESWIQWEWKDWCEEDQESLHSSSQNARWGACKTGYGSPLYPSDNWMPDRTALAQMAIPYPQAVAGRVVITSWEGTPRIYQLKYILDTSIHSATEVFVNPELTFPAGINITVTPPEAVNATMDVEKRKLFLVATSEAESGQEVSVVLAARGGSPTPSIVEASIVV